ncbi:plasmid replication initiator TrfA [Clostridium mediterraneense]|uniref:plasmid replication initiator TrfA n=1 Tax=Clostridium mediterraneense TaxID=1805472 RepID=UPI00083464DC|nr:plasmid replication initiator TrfA [Clostridium mediterraneense]
MSNKKSVEIGETKSKEKDRTIREKSFIMDINVIEAPLFRFKNKRTVQTIAKLENDETISKEMRYVLSRVPEESKSSQVEFLSWTDSKGLEREILAMSMFRLPNAFAMDVFYALIGVYIKQHSPLIYSDEDKTYDLPSNKVDFTLYELCEFMGLSVGGGNYQKIKDAIRELNAVKYYSLANGIFYNKKMERYESSREKSISLIDNYDIIGKGKNRSKEERCTVTFGDLVIENMRYSFIKFLSNNVYFQLKSGLTRRLYSYIEGNNFNKQYIKRSFDVLKHKIPIDFEYKSELKRRLKKPLENLIESGILKDYFFGDDILINGVSENCIYIIFKGTRKQLIDSLTEKPKDIKVEKKKDLEEDYSLKFPENIKEELSSLGINSKKITEILQKHTKWKIAEYILWIKDGIRRGKVKDPAGLFVFAITDEMVKVNKTHPEITEFIDRIKREIEGKKDIDENLIKSEYRKYIEQELKLFEEEDEFAYVATKESIMDDIEKVQKKRIKSQRQLYNMATTEAEKDKLLKVIEKWEKFSVEKDKSEIFIELFVKKIKLYRGLKDFSDYKIEYLEKNK